MDPIQLGFFWPTPTLLTNRNGEHLNIWPHSVNTNGVERANGQRIGQCYHYYSTERGILTELELGNWLAGGVVECMRLSTMLRELFEEHERLSHAEIFNLLRAHNFADVTIDVNIRWLIQDGLVAVQEDAGDWIYSNLRM